MIYEDLDFMDAKMLRQKAEEQLKEKQQKSDNPVDEYEVKRLLHELQVHQIELEMQNDELRLAYETTELALKKYTMLYDFAPIGYFTLSKDGHILELNFTGSELLGDRPINLINSNFKSFVSAESKALFSRFFTEVYSSIGVELCELKLSTASNPLCPVYIEGIVTGENKECLLSVVDISAFRKQKKC